MDRVELIKKLENLSTGDPETNHMKADKLLVEYLNDERIKEAYQKITKWYA